MFASAQTNPSHPSLFLRYKENKRNVLGMLQKFVFVVSVSYLQREQLYVYLRPLMFKQLDTLLAHLYHLRLKIVCMTQPFRNYGFTEMTLCQCQLYI